MKVLLKKLEEEYLLATKKHPEDENLLFRWEVCRAELSELKAELVANNPSVDRIETEGLHVAATALRLVLLARKRSD